MPLTPPLRTREVLLHALLLIALLAFVFPGVFLRGEHIVPGGLLYHFPPWRAHQPEGLAPNNNLTALDALCMFHLYNVQLKRAIAEGAWPLWNPYEYLGMPLLANAQSAFFYPPRFLHALLDTHLATTLHVLLKLWLCGMTAYWFAREIRLGVTGARFASVAWMLGGYNLTWCYWAEPDVSAWFPVLLIGVERLIAARWRGGFFAMASAATLILLAGHPESAFAMGSIAGIYFVIRAAQSIFRPARSRFLIRAIVLACAAWAVALLAAAGQLLPFLEYLRNSYHFIFRAAEDPALHAIPLEAALLFWVPAYFGISAEDNYRIARHILDNSNFTNLIFPGTVVWLGLPALYFAIRQRPRCLPDRVVALTGMAIVAFVLSFASPLTPTIARLPVLHSMWLLWHVGPGLFALAMLGAIGVDAWFAQPRRFPHLIGPLALTLAVGAIVLALYDFHLPLLKLQGQVEYVQQQLRWAAAITTLGLASLATHCAVRRSQLLPLALTLVLAVDLLAAVRSLHVTAPRRALYPRTALTDFLVAQDRPIRVSTLNARIPTGLLAAYGIEEWLGYDGLTPLRYERFRREIPAQPDAPIQRALGITHHLYAAGVSPSTLPQSFRQVAQLDGVNVFEDSAAFPRAFLLSNAEVIPDIEAQFERMRRPDFDPARIALLEHGPPPSLPDPAPTGSGSARVIHRSAHSVTLEATVAQPAIVVLTDAYYPGWAATVNGKAVEVFPVDYIFRGVLVPKGEHRIEFRYLPASFRIGIVIATAALAVGLFIGLLCLGRAAPRPLA